MFSSSKRVIWLLPILKERFSPKELEELVGPEIWKDMVERRLVYMPIIWINKEQKLFKEWEKSALKPLAYELCIKKAKPAGVLKTLAAKTGKGGARIWINTLWDSLCAGRTDDRGYDGDPDGSWGWWLKEGATMLQTDRPKELLEYLDKSGRRKFAPAQ